MVAGIPPDERYVNASQRWYTPVIVGDRQRTLVQKFVFNMHKSSHRDQRSQPFNFNHSFENAEGRPARVRRTLVSRYRSVPRAF